MKKHFALFLALISVLLVKAQVTTEVRADIRNAYCYPGLTYVVITNSYQFDVQVFWRCIDVYGRYLDGQIYLPSGHETWVGPNVGWRWEDGESFIYSVKGISSNQISFRASEWIPVEIDVNSSHYRSTGCSCKTYKGKKRAGLDEYKGDCTNYINGHKCGHGPKAHGLKEY